LFRCKRFQAEDRAHRIGQQKSVFIKYILCKDTYDDDMWELAMKKNKVWGKAVSDADLPWPSLFRLTRALI
jgi:SNF2 family DNA or RNA helicase